jgi:flagellar biogenesis protein FliO
VNWNHVRKAEKGANAADETWSLALWLLGKLRRTRTSEPRMALIERISLAPKQSLALVEAEGRRFLVASSADGAATFYLIEDAVPKRTNRAAKARVAW